MDTADLHPQVEALADNIDDLEEALGPLLQSALSAHASKLPLLDKAKLYTLVTYAIESILFSYLNLNGVEAKKHAVFTELTRIRQYFQKIKQVEDAPVKPGQTLDKAAANRFIKAGLAGNDQYDKERALRQAKERALAHLKLVQLNKKRKADDVADEAKESAESSSSSSSSSSESESEEEQPVEEPKAKRSKRAKAADLWEGEASEKKKGKKSKKGKKESKAEQAEDLEEGEVDAEGAEAEETGGARKKKSSHVPLGHKAAFQALLEGPIPKREEQQKGKKKAKGKRKSKS